MLENVRLAALLTTYIDLHQDDTQAHYMLPFLKDYTKVETAAAQTLGISSAFSAPLVSLLYLLLLM